MVVYDTRSDSLATLLHMPSCPWAILSNPALERVYVGVHWSAILVYPDSLPAGIAAQPSALARRRSPQTVIRNILFLPDASGIGHGASSALLDISGRKVLGLKPGANDVRCLAPGVYFVREEPQAASLKPQAVRKVVLTE